MGPYAVTQTPAGALVGAAAAGNLTLVRRMLAPPITVGSAAPPLEGTDGAGRTALAAAVQNGRCAVTRYLLAHGARCIQV